MSIYDDAEKINDIIQVVRRFLDINRTTERRNVVLLHFVHHMGVSTYRTLSI